MSSWYVSPICVPLSTSRDRRFLWRMVEPIWSMMSSPTTRAFFFLYLACHVLFEAIFAGVALMNARPACRAAWAYMSLAFEAPVGVRLTSTSVLVSSRTSVMLDGFALLGCILSPAIGDIPSSGWAIWTLTPMGRNSTIFFVLFGSAYTDSDRSFPTFLSSMSNAATNRMSDTL